EQLRIVRSFRQRGDAVADGAERVLGFHSFFRKKLFDFAAQVRVGMRAEMFFQSRDHIDGAVIGFDDRFVDLGTLGFVALGIEGRELREGSAREDRDEREAQNGFQPQNRDHRHYFYYRFYAGQTKQDPSQLLDM